MSATRGKRNEGPVGDLLTESRTFASTLDDADEPTWRIIAAAREQIEAVGWRRSTMEDIARRARLGRATLYRKFPTKDDILAGIVAAETRNYYLSRGAVTDRPTAEDRICESVVFTIEYIRSNAMLNRLLDTEPESIMPALTRDAGPLYTLVADLSIPTWQRELLGDRVPTAEQLRHFRTVAELHTRIALSFMMSRDSEISLDSPERIRLFARQYLAPLLLDLPQ